MYDHDSELLMNVITSLQPFYYSSHEQHKSLVSEDRFNPFVIFQHATLTMYLETFMKYITLLLFF